MILGFRRNSIGIFQTLFCFLFILGIFTALFSLLSCRTTGGPYGPGSPAHLARIEGPWLFNANNFPGRVEFHWTGEVWTGRILFNNIAHWEELRDIFFDPRTGQLQFRRLSANQVYSGTVSGNRIVGTFGYGAPGGFQWEAWRH